MTVIDNDCDDDMMRMRLMRIMRMMRRVACS